MQRIDISLVVQKGGFSERVFFQHLSQQGIYWWLSGKNLNFIILEKPEDLDKIRIHFPEVTSAQII